MTERLLLFFKETGINSSQFAQKIGVQRSNISHIISGRSKPGYDFLLKMMHSYPEVNIEWLLTGKGSMFKIESRSLMSSAKGDGKPDINESAERKTSESILPLPGITDKSESTHTPFSGKKPTAEEVYKSKQYDNLKRIDKIVIFFTDKTFTSYIPDE